MSKGLGKGYLTEAVKEWHYADMLNRMFLTVEDGKKVSMPRYYKNKIYTKPDREAIGNHLSGPLQDAIMEQVNTDPDYFRNKSEKFKEALRKMHHKSTQNRNLN